MSDEIKKVDTLMQTSIGRNKGGIKVIIKTHPVVEDFMKSFGGGDVPVESYGRLWTPANLKVYWLPDELAGVQMTESPRLTYRLDRPGQPLMIDDGMSKYPCVNLSFLRLVDSSGAEGISFSVPNVISRDGIRDLSSSIRSAQRAFNLAYMKPITINVTMTSQEVPFYI